MVQYRPKNSCGFVETDSLRSERFQSSYCASVRARAKKKKVEGGGGEEKRREEEKRRSV